MKTLVRAAAILMVVAFVSGCSQKGFNTNLTVEPNPVPGIDWTQYKNWSFGRQGEYVQTGIPDLDAPEFRKSVGDNAIKLMSALGYTHVNATPDMLLMFHVVVEQRYDEVKMNPAYQDFDMQWAQASSIRRELRRLQIGAGQQRRHVGGRLAVHFCRRRQNGQADLELERQGRARQAVQF